METLDAKLTIYALANGMDLVKSPTGRRLEWYRDGHDRGIVFGESPGGGIEIAVEAWTRREAEGNRVTSQVAGLPLEEVHRDFSALMQRAQDAANSL